MSAFRFDKASDLARSVKALPSLKGDAYGAASDAGQERNEGEEQGLARKKDGRRAAEKRAKQVERRKERARERRRWLQQELAGQEVSDEWRDPPPERIETAHLRQLPDFVIIGAQRGGTTSLYRYLTEHPDIGSSFRKEVHFFERFYERGMDWYLAHFPERGQAAVVGEASPNYLFHPDVPKRVWEALPHARFIVLLRNLVDRAYAHYYMKVKRGMEPLSFEDAIDKEPERLWVGYTDDPASTTWRHYSYIKRGLYVEQLERWMSVFPREQFLIIKSEDLYENPERVLHQTLAYLGLQPCGFQGVSSERVRRHGPATCERLAEYFAPYNQQLYAFLGRDLGWEHE